MQLLEDSSVVRNGGDGAIVDLGSGWGSLIIPIALKYPDRTITGYELSLIPWLFSWLTIKCLGLKNVVLYRQDFLKAELSDTSILICYLYPEAMVALEAQLEDHKPQLRYLISNNFALPSFKPDKTIELDDLYRSPIYGYCLSNTQC
jgi:hypothetical protein